MIKALTTRLLGAVLLALVAVLPARAAEDRTHAYAVVVGIDTYADQQIKPRAHAEADAKALFDVFTASDYLGVVPGHARLLLGKADPARKSEPATRENILKALH